MDTDLISFESMLASRDSAIWGYWTMLWTLGAFITAFISMLVTLLTLQYAKKALSTWREQEQTKAKLDFKKSILGIRNILMYMPEKWSDADHSLAQGMAHAPDYQKHFKQNLLELPSLLKMLLDAQNQANDSWVICEHLFDDTDIAVKWIAVMKALDGYIQRGLSRDDLFESLNELYSQRFVFEFR